MTCARRNVAKQFLHYLEQSLRYHRAGLPKQFLHYFLKQFLRYHRAGYILVDYRVDDYGTGGTVMIGVAAFEMEDAGVTHARRNVAKHSLHYFLEQFLNYHRAGLPKQSQHYFLEQFLHYHSASYIPVGFKV